MLGITIATAPNLLDNALFAIPSGVYGLVMCISGIFVINFSKKTIKRVIIYSLIIMQLSLQIYKQQL